MSDVGFVMFDPEHQRVRMSMSATEILIISDSAEERSRLERLFQSGVSKRFHVTAVDQGKAGLEVIRNQKNGPIGCVMLREQLPDMDAFAFLRELKTASQGRHFAVILLADPGSSAGAQFLRAGAQDYLVAADFTSDLLCRSVDHAIERELLLSRDPHGQDTTLEGDSNFREILEQASEAIVVLDQHGSIVLANAKAREIFGYSDGQLPGRHVEVLMPKALRDPNDGSTKTLLEPGASGTESNLELIGIRQDGMEFPIEVSLSPLETNRSIVISCIVRDITLHKQVVDKLQKSDQQLRFIMDSMPPKIFTAGPNGDIDYYNSQCTDFTGLSFDQLSGWKWTQFLHADDAIEYERLWRQAIETKQPFEIESRFRRYDGQYRWHFCRVIPRCDAVGQVVMWIGSQTDIHDMKEAEAALHVSEIRYRRLFEAAKDGILILDFTTGKIVDANPFMTMLLGYSREAFIGLELWELGLFGDRSANEAAVQILQQDGYLRYEHLPLESRDGRRVEVEVVANAYAENDHQVIQCNIRDITERSLMEKRLQDQATELQDQNRRKDEFLAMLSHELRSPLAPIANAVQLFSLQEGSESRVQQQARNIIERQLGKLQHLVDDLLEVSRISSGRVQLRQDWVAVKSIVDGAVETVRYFIEQRRHRLSVVLPDEPLWLHGDSARLEQVLVNLLVNAAKYTEEGGQVWVTVSRESTECVISVRDNGVGIDDKLLPYVFDLFTQAERSLDRSQGGLGIGLALARRLTELHHGTIEARSEPSEGSEFIVRLPLPARGAEDGPPVRARRGKSIPPMRILVVDDTVDTAVAFSMLLRAYGHEVRTAHDGIVAVEIAAEFLPEVVVLDIGLPGLDGYEAARADTSAVRRRQNCFDRTDGLRARDSDRQKSDEAGFNYHMVKPADFNQC